MNFKFKREKIINITSGSGKGDTDLSAFDAALWDAGIANFNLITLSSIIPPKSEMVLKKITQLENKNYGDRLYVVLAEKRENEKGREAWAGIGWVQAEDGRGLFVEHIGASNEEVVRLINATLNSMMGYRSTKYGEIKIKTEGIECRDKPVCVLVCAVVGIEKW